MTSFFNYTKEMEEIAKKQLAIMILAQIDLIKNEEQDLFKRVLGLPNVLSNGYNNRQMFTFLATLKQTKREMISYFEMLFDTEIFEEHEWRTKLYPPTPIVEQ